MKSYNIWLLVLLITSVTARFKNITNQWTKKLNTTINFQVISGYQQIDWYYEKTTTGMYFTLFSNYNRSILNESSTIPLILWLQGGPGSSSQFGAFTQIGPILIIKGQPKLQGSSWNRVAHLLFVDSPLNTGFSFHGDRLGKTQVNSTDTATNHLVNFLYYFYKEFPTLKNSPFYIAGESFAGHYIPNLANKILFNSTFTSETGMQFKGVMIGNGWVDPINQINYYDSYLWSVGIIENTFKEVCIWYQTNSIVHIYRSQFAKATDYFNFITHNQTNNEQFLGNISLYNFRNYDGVDRSYGTFLNDSKSQFGGECDFFSSNTAIYDAFGNDITRSHTNEVSSALFRLKVLIYNGQNDVVANNAGVLQYINSLSWSGLFNWKRTQKQIWHRNGQIVGWAKVSGNLWFIHVNNAGHMVPTDQPEVALSMLEHFVFQDKNWNQ